MKINTVWAIYFSPVGNTEKIITSIADSIGKELDAVVKKLDYTLPITREEKNLFCKSDLVIWGTPVYAGRIPNKLLSYVQNNFIGNDALAVPVVVFGNRSFDDALVELQNMLEGNGFHTIAGAGFVAQHAFSDILSVGRPDKADMDSVQEFSERISEKSKMLEGIPCPICLKGNNPPKEYYTPKGLDGKPAVFLKAKPKTDAEKCNSCGVCVNSCPMGAINKENPAEITGICIKCHACINKCRKKAKFFDDKAFLSHKLMLERDFKRRTEPEVFI
nr:EFR1 family ferrodoxin [uncultured Aminipila sp.]